MNLAFLDTETSHVNAYEGCLLDICVKQVNPKDGNVLKSYSSKIIPTEGAAFLQEAIEVNGYKEDDWKDAVSLEEALIKSFDIMEGCRVIAHNPWFDMSFITYASFLTGVPFPKLGNFKPLDTASMMYPLCISKKIPNNRLETICEYLGIEIKNQHTAEGDVDAIIEVYKRLIKDFYLEEIPF